MTLAYTFAALGALVVGVSVVMAYRYGRQDGYRRGKLDERDRITRGRYDVSELYTKVKAARRV